MERFKISIGSDEGQEHLSREGDESPFLRPAWRARASLGFLLLCVFGTWGACSQEGATGTTAERATAEPLVASCPPGTEETSSAEAGTDCGGPLTALSRNRSGTASGLCLNKGTSYVKCVPNPGICGAAGIAKITSAGVQCNTPATGTPEELKREDNKAEPPIVAADEPKKPEEPKTIEEPKKPEESKFHLAAMSTNVIDVDQHVLQQRAEDTKIAEDPKSTEESKNSEEPKNADEQKPTQEGKNIYSPCSGGKPWMVVRSARAALLKDQTFSIELELASMFKDPVALVVANYPAAVLRDDANNPSPKVDSDFPYASWMTSYQSFQTGSSYAKAYFERGMPLSKEEPKFVNFTSSRVEGAGREISFVVHIIVAEKNSAGAFKASQTILRCEGLPIKR